MPLSPLDRGRPAGPRPLRILLPFLLAALAGCESVPFYKKAALSRPTMDMGFDPTAAHFDAKVLYSIEGAAGGIGTSAGGGCGCY